MHISRILALLGVVVAVVGMLLKSLVHEGTEALAELSQALPQIPIPIEIPTIWGGLDTSAQIVVAIVLMVIVVLALWPPLKQPQNRLSAAITTLAGVGFLVFAVVKLNETQDDASGLQTAFDQAKAAGVLPSALQDAIVSPGIGFYIIIIGTALVSLAGLIALIRGRVDTAEA